MANCGGTASAYERCGKTGEKLFPVTAVRYGRMNYIGEFSHPPDMPITCGGKVIILTERGIEIGQQVQRTCFGCNQSVTRDQMRAYAQTSGEEFYQIKNGRILRPATDADLAELRHIEEGCRTKLASCRAIAAELGLQMKIVDCEHIFGGERVVFYFMSEDRIDFRELVRRLAAEFQTRIEMRQVGARDEARLLADYETCGRECCCRNFLKTLRPIGMQMAKLQKATLDPSKVSGRCGRLKCCLRYEHETYESLVKKLPRVGARVMTKEGAGKVIDRQILTQLVRILGDDDRVFVIHNEDITERLAPTPGAGGQGPARPHEEEPAPSRRQRSSRETEVAADSVDGTARQDEPVAERLPQPQSNAHTEESAAPTAADKASPPPPAAVVPQTMVPGGGPPSPAEVSQGGRRQGRPRRRRRGRGRDRRSGPPPPGQAGRGS